MKAIIELQRAYFFTQDSEDLNPLVLRDVAEKANLDISTVSRVCSSKYALVDGIIHPLSDFFFHLRKNSEGEMVEANKVIKMLEDIIANEDKTAPLSDEQLAEKLKSNGLSLSRRTVAKYRKDMGIPVAKNRLADYGNSNILNSKETI
jgi:RNA polymerase sigma-54 factor